MSGITIKTDHKYRPILQWWDLTHKEQEEFSYLDTEDKQFEATFVRYRKIVYHIEDIERIDHAKWGCNADPFIDWHGYQGDSFFSGIVMAYSRDYEYVKMGTYFA